MNSESLQRYFDKAVELSMEYSPKLILALLTLFIGLRFLKLLRGLITKGFEKGNVDVTLRPFILNILNVVLKVILFIVVASMIGIETTSLVALLGAAGLAIGLALQGSLGNFAGGVVILVFKPFVVDDWIEVEGKVGKVEEIQIFNTLLRTRSNMRIVIPNGVLSNHTVVNITARPNIRLDLTFGISYADSVTKAKEVLYGVLKDNEKVLDDPEPFVGVSEHGDSSINFTVRPWVKNKDYWRANYEIQEAVKLAFDKEGITIPFPQRDVHLYEQK
ncbi:MAG: mechanosensitive ion channel family protein [Flavobacteriales bacterium]|nr:mechanosensitive ion channel family protein [Flavobacteriales bacterium]